jgi:ribosomal protein S24E
MKFEITKETHNHLMGRVELEGLLTGAKSTPTRKEVLALVAGAKSVNPEQVVIQKVAQPFGVRQVKVTATVYPNVEAVKKSRGYFAKRGVAKEKKAAK